MGLPFPWMPEGDTYTACEGLDNWPKGKPGRPAGAAVRDWLRARSRRGRLGLLAGPRYIRAR